MDSLYFQQACTGGLIFNDKGEMLFVKRADDDEFFAGYWELPGGGTDYGENPQESLKREIKEECGLEVEISYPLGVHTYTMPVANRESQRVEITFLCKLKHTDPQVVLSHEHSDYRWLTKEKISDIKLSDYMQKVVLDCLANPTIEKI